MADLRSQTVVVDAALEAHPLTAQRISQGDHRFTAGIHAFARRLITTGYDRPSVEALILERASR
jgi:hypothetical protein